MHGVSQEPARCSGWQRPRDPADKAGAALNSHQADLQLRTLNVSDGFKLLYLHFSIMCANLQLDPEIRGRNPL